MYPNVGPLFVTITAFSFIFGSITESKITIWDTTIEKFTALTVG